MTATSTRKRRRSRHPGFLQKPRGAFHPRVQQVGPEHFGIVTVDCAKARSFSALFGPFSAGYLSFIASSSFRHLAASAFFSQAS
jgi:hypothetical protein